MKNLNTFIFVPNSLQLQKNGFLEGSYKKINDCSTYYITNEKTQSQQTSRTIGKVHSKTLNESKNKPFIFMDSTTSKCTVTEPNEPNPCLIYIHYDYRTFKNSNVINLNYELFGEHFKTLNEQLKLNDAKKTNGIKLLGVVRFFVYILDVMLKVIGYCKKLLPFSATILQLEQSLEQLKWFLNGCCVDKASPKLGNALVAKAVDIMLGLMLLDFILNNQDLIADRIFSMAQDIITNLKELLLYLMGSPIGLKLNHAFNTCLGTFFFYHIRLWRLFLQGMPPIIVNYFNILCTPGWLGITFQIAMISDIVAITTFHVYCIYVYAARLFNLQINGIISLWRLFIGRKYNPLRDRVDSCNYTQNQLFIGTMGFSVLLFLLPTTVMYYTVFLTLRLVVIMIDVILSKLRHVVSRLPFFVATLWAFNSPSIAGNVYIKVLESDEQCMELEAKLLALPLLETIEKFVPFDCNEKSSKDHSVTKVLHNIFTGRIL